MENPAQDLNSTLGSCTQIQGLPEVVWLSAGVDEAIVPSGSLAVLHEPRTALLYTRFGAAEPLKTLRTAQTVEVFEVFGSSFPIFGDVARRGWSLLMANPVPRWRERFAISSLRHPSWHGALPAALYDRR